MLGWENILLLDHGVHSCAKQQNITILLHIINNLLVFSQFTGRWTQRWRWRRESTRRAWSSSARTPTASPTRSPPSEQGKTKNKYCEKNHTQKLTRKLTRFSLKKITNTSYLWVFFLYFAKIPCVFKCFYVQFPFPVSGPRGAQHPAGCRVPGPNWQGTVNFFFFSSLV